MGAATSAASFGIQVMGQGRQLRAIKENTKAAQARAGFKTQVLRNNKAVSEQAAENARERGEILVDRARLSREQVVGRTKVALAASGVVVDEGSAVDLLSDVDFVGAHEDRDILFNAEVQAVQHELDAMNTEADARLIEAGADDVKRLARLQKTLIGLQTIQSSINVINETFSAGNTGGGSSGATGKGSTAGAGKTASVFSAFGG